MSTATDSSKWAMHLPLLGDKMPFIKVENGTVSIQLRGLTITTCLMMGGMLVWMLYYTCEHPDLMKAHDLQCNSKRIPFISDIINIHMFDKFFVFFSCLYMLTAQQANIRAFYKLCYGKIPESQNKACLIMGIFPIFAFPMIGVWDETFHIAHVTLTMLFLAVCMIYALVL